MQHSTERSCARVRMADVRRKVAVRLHVYDLIERWNDYGYLIGLGAFHSGVEVLGRGCSFALLRSLSFILAMFR